MCSETMRSCCLQTSFSFTGNLWPKLSLTRCVFSSSVKLTAGKLLGGHMGCFLFSVSVVLFFGLSPVLQRSEQDSEQCVLIEQTLWSVSQLLESSDGLSKLLALLLVLLLQTLPLSQQFLVVGLQAMCAQGQSAVVAPQLGQLLGQALTGLVQHLHLLLKSKGVGPEQGIGLCTSWRSVRVSHRVWMLQDKAQQVGQADGQVLRKLDTQMFPEVTNSRVNTKTIKVTLCPSKSQGYNVPNHIWGCTS